MERADEEFRNKQVHEVTKWLRRAQMCNFFLDGGLNALPEFDSTHGYRPKDIKLHLITKRDQPVRFKQLTSLAEVCLEAITDATLLDKRTLWYKTRYVVDWGTYENMLKRIRDLTMCMNVTERFLNILGGNIHAYGSLTYDDLMGKKKDFDVVDGDKVNSDLWSIRNIMSSAKYIIILQSVCSLKTLSREGFTKTFGEPVLFLSDGGRPSPSFM